MSMSSLQPHAVAEGSQCCLDTLQAVLTVAAHRAQFLQALLLVMYGTLNALRWRLAAGFLQQCCGDECVVLLQRAEQDPQ